MVLTLVSAAFVLSILIITHELGHYSAARLLGVRVIRFSLGLGPRIAGFKRGETEYVLSAVPFGGYVKLAGMEESDRQGAEDEYSSKSTPARIWILLSGPLANFVLAFLLYLVITSAIGTSVLETTTVGHVEAESAAFDAGIREGDQILTVGDRAVSNWNEIMEGITEQRQGANVKVRRDGVELWFLMEPSEQPGLIPFIEPVVGRVQKGSPAEEAGLRQGDRIVSIGDTEIERWEDLLDVVQTSFDTSLPVSWIRDGQRFTGTVVPKSELTVEDGQARKTGVIGVSMPVSKVKLPSLQAISVSSGTTLWVMRQILSFLGRLITGRASVRMLGGGIFIAKMAGETVRWGIDSLLNFMAFLSINLFIINLFPIPMLDGGHIVYNLIEAGRGKPLSLRQKGIAQHIGLAILVVIIVFVLLMDLMRLTQ